MRVCSGEQPNKAKQQQRTLAPFAICMYLFFFSVSLCVILSGRCSSIDRIHSRVCLALQVFLGRNTADNRHIRTNARPTLLEGNSYYATDPCRSLLHLPSSLCWSIMRLCPLPPVPSLAT